MAERFVVPAVTLIVFVLVTCADIVHAQMLPSAEPEAVGLSSERLARLEPAMRAEVDEGRKVGIVTLVARHGRIAHLRAYGMADRESGTRMTTEHLFRLYSMTKPVTSVALLMLYEEGRFQLSDTLEQHIPAFRNLKVFAGMQSDGTLRLEEPKRKPTVHDLFRDTAGFAYGLIGQTPIDALYRDNGIDLQRLPSLSLTELVENRLSKLPLLYPPGDRWVYSIAHDIQAYLVERFSGIPFAEFVRRRIFEPLGMRDTVFGVPQAYVPRFTSHYQQMPGGALARIETRDGRSPDGTPRYGRYTSAPFGGIGLSSTAPDYARFAQMLLDGGRGRGVQLLSRKTVELMTTNHLPPTIPSICCPPGLAPSGYGYGLGVFVSLGPVASGNLGSAGTFGWPGGASTFVFIDPKEQMLLLLMTQYAPADGELSEKFQTLAYQAIVD